MSTLGRQSEKRAAIEASVLRATEELLRDGASFAELGIERIATRAGISRTAFYFYFRDKRELLVRLTQDVNAELLDAAASWWSGQADLRTALGRIASIYEAHGALLRAVVEVSTYDTEVAGFWRGLIARFVDATRETIERERPGSAPADAIAFSLCWMVERTLYQRHAQGHPEDLDELVEAIATIFERTVYGPSLRVWVDFTNTAHVVVLRPLVELLEARGDEVVLTARPLSHTLELLDDWGHEYTPIGQHGGASRLGKARRAFERVRAMRRFGRERGPFDAALAHGSTDLPMACRLLRVPNTTMFDYEFALVQHHVNGRFANRVLVPEAIPPERLRKFGMRGAKLVRYPGLKEEYVLHGFEPDPAVPEALGVDPARPLVVVRPAASYALYVPGTHDLLLPSLLDAVLAKGAQVVVLPRTPEQADQVRRPGVIVPPRAIESRSLVAYADALVSGGGSMNREAVALGTPVWTMFEGLMGGVDEALVREGRLQVLRDPSDVVVPETPAPKPRRPPVTRDPADLLRLALG